MNTTTLIYYFSVFCCSFPS